MATPRLPTPGQDDGTWGDILNEYLSVAHNSDGSLKSSAITSPVSSVAGKTGAVTLAQNDIANLTTDLAAKAPLASPTFTGTPTVGGDVVATASQLANYAAAAPVANYTYNSNGTVAMATENGITTTYGYNSDGTVHTITRLGLTLTYSYNADGTVSGVA